MKVTPDLGFKISDHIWKPGFQWQRGGAFQREVLKVEIVNRPSVVLNCKSKLQKAATKAKDNRHTVHVRFNTFFPCSYYPGCILLYVQSLS